MMVRCPACEAKFDSDVREPRCPHKLLDCQYRGQGGDIRRTPPDLGTGWCEIHAAWDCQEMHGYPEKP
jgi:hypothetical protein